MRGPGARARRAVVVGGLLVGLALVVAGCRSNDNGGVITGTTPPTAATTTTPGPTTTSTLPGGTLPAS